MKSFAMLKVLAGENGKPIGFPESGYPGPQGPYYCAVGSENIAGRDIVEEHLDTCLAAGIEITGINAEVMLGQWEYQCFGKGAKEAADSLILSRYLLHRISEKYGVKLELHPKPIKGDWNGSGMHTNFSNTNIRTKGSEAYFHTLLKGFEKYHKAHIAEYGEYNDQRLVGAYETPSIDEYTYGVSDRGAAIRIPLQTVKDGWKGYIEDRRPGSNGDPYRIVSRIIKTVNEIESKMGASKTKVTLKKVTKKAVKA